jgi:radial spoke head protein 3
MAQSMQTYSSQPQAAPGKRKGGYRDDEPDYVNLMNDPRVVRGSTHTPVPKAMNTTKNTKLMSRTGPLPAKSTYKSTRNNQTYRNTTTVNTSDFLEELTDRPIEIDMEVQPKSVSDRPHSPLFVQATVGRDVHTQIAAGDLFDFDLEVVPYLEVLVGRTLHVAMLEVKQEDEIETIFKKQMEFEQIRNIELAEVQRLEAAHQRRLDEQLRRHGQAEQRIIDIAAREKTKQAKLTAQECLTDLHSTVLDALDEKGHFKDPLEKEINDTYLSELTKATYLSLNNHYIACQITDDLFADALERARDQSIAAGFTDEAADAILIEPPPDLAPAAVSEPEPVAAELEA